jgi:endonuclease III
MRTLLSANTSKRNSTLALDGLNSAFGIRTSGTGKGSIKWEAVQEATRSQIEQAIKRGGMANRKSGMIKEVLDIVYTENCARRDALLAEKATGDPAIAGASHEPQTAKDAEIARAEENLLSMQYILEMTNDKAMDEMTRLPGIGVKTASCVILFSMRRPSFAVDTHVFRLCQLLGWVPEKGADRNKTFSHLEVRVPNELKYSLHMLFVHHGRNCGRCTAKGSAQAYDSTDCPIEHLVRRRPRKANKGKKEVVVDEGEHEGPDSDEVME